MTDIITLWRKFEEEFLGALAHHYNDEDYEEYVKPIRETILGVPVLYLYDFTVTKMHGLPIFNVFYGANDYIGKCVTKQAIVNRACAYIKSQPNWNGPTSEQFEYKFWQVSGEL